MINALHQLRKQTANMKKKTSTFLIIFSLALFIQPLHAQSALLYGMTADGGTGGLGTVISYDPHTDSERVVSSFGTGTDGRMPHGGLTYDTRTGLFYGLTLGGGDYSVGTIFSLDPVTGTETVVWSFGYGPDGANPYGSLQYDTATGLLYGTTTEGGIDSFGSIFSYNPATGRDTVEWSFGRGTDGANPQSTLVYSPGNGLYYGMTPFGGFYDGGTIFSFNPITHAEHIAWDFGTDSDGQYPSGSLAYDTTRSIFYAMTSGGGASGAGALISFDPATNQDSLIHSFGATGDAATPDGELVYDPITLLYYGLATKGGSNNKGALISFDPAADTVGLLWSFGTGADGAIPYGDLTFYSINRILYGMTELGGTDRVGTIFSFDPATGRDSVLYSFDSTGTDGQHPYGSLIQYTPPSSACPAITVTATEQGDSLAYASASGGIAPYIYTWSTVPTQYTDTVHGLMRASQYTVIATDQNGCTGSATVNLGVGIIPLTAPAALSLYPNPTTGTVYIEGLAAGQATAVYNELGNRVATIMYTSTAQQLDLSAQTPGIYLIAVIDKDGSVASLQKVAKE
jgi:uncharacterized repeat protein (TIGR03803 family)